MSQKYVIGFPERKLPLNQKRQEIWIDVKKSKVVPVHLYYNVKQKGTTGKCWPHVYRKVPEHLFPL